MAEIFSAYENYDRVSCYIYGYFVFSGLYELIFLEDKKMLQSLSEVTSLKLDQNRFYSATHDEIKSGATTDIYFINTRDVLDSADKLNTQVTAEIFTRTYGLFAGLDEVKELLKDSDVQIEALPEGERFSPKEVLMRIKGPYGAFGIFETTLLGMLSSSCAWATAARECVDAAGGKPVLFTSCCSACYGSYSC